MDKTDAFVPGKRFRWDKMECWWALGVATGEEAWKLRLVMKSEDVRENRGVLANCISYQLVRIKTFSH